MMTVYLTLVLTATLFGLMLTPLVSTASSALGLLDAPGGRKVHSLSVPRVGGLAISLAAGLTLAGVAALAPWWGAVSPPIRPLVPILLGAALVLAIGLLDDLRALPVWPKLLVQVGAAVLVMLSGLRIERITLGGDTWQLGLLAWPVTLGWIVGLTNAFNLIDGLDGLAAGIAVIAGATCAAILISRGHAAEAMLLAAMVGAALGFLVYNFAPASIFLGDGGSLLFGFVLATTAITGWQKGATALAAGVPLLIFALPIADAATTLVRRLLRRPSEGRVTVRQVLRQIAEPDREHIHHRLMALGWSTQRTVLLLYAVTLVLSFLALATVRLD
jgi:UDP-GlcNAc:undecaprenyl-phosphate/decaprenyl-phosphate GlcNAc-1-phosphate transferase